MDTVVHNHNEKVHLVAGRDTWLETLAVDQLKKVAELPGMRRVVGYPDLHPGKSGPVGAVFLSEQLIYPYLVGNDIGCGFGLWKTDNIARKFKLDRAAARLSGLNLPWKGNIAAWTEKVEVSAEGFPNALGTIGGGNHFAEVQLIDKVLDEELFQSFSLDRESVYLMIHSGSRSLGESIYRRYTSEVGASGIALESELGERYMQEHSRAVSWARANRRLIAERVAEMLRCDLEAVIDVPHNIISRVDSSGPLLAHRKGASPTTGDLLMIAGTRDSHTYLVAPTAQSRTLDFGFSTAHGSGRKWMRSQCKGRLDKKYSAAALRRTSFGGYVVCGEKDLLYEEAPQAYKKVESVIEDLTNAGLVKIVALLRPVITYKTDERE